MKLQVGRAIAILALTAVSACSNEAHQLMAPSLSNPRLNVGGAEGAQSTVCVSGDSPAGNYTFTVTHVDYAAGGSTVPAPSSAVVARGTCFALVTRLIADVDPDPVTTITYSYASNDALGGAGYSGTTCVDHAGIPAAGSCNEMVVGYVNIVAGTDATFSFISGAQMIESLRGILSDADLKKGSEHKLNDILDHAAKELGKGKNNSRACDELNHFANELDHGPKKIGATDLATILAKLSDIETALGC
jgi:hypothetical protein